MRASHILSFQLVSLFSLALSMTQIEELDTERALLYCILYERYALFAHKSVIDNDVAQMMIVIIACFYV